MNAVLEKGTLYCARVSLQPYCESPVNNSGFGEDDIFCSCPLFARKKKLSLCMCGFNTQYVTSAAWSVRGEKLSSHISFIKEKKS